MAHAKSSDPNVFILPDLGEGVHEAELIKWRVGVGDTVEEHDILAEMETDKALVEVPSPRAGVIETLHGKPGEILHVGNPLVSYQSSGDATKRPTDAATKRRSDEATEDRAAGGRGAGGHRASAGAAAAEEREDAGTVVGSLSANPAVEGTPGKALATPAVRRIARDMGVDIDSVAGSGLGGRVTERDVRTAAERGAGGRMAGERGGRGMAAQPAPGARRETMAVENGPVARGGHAPAHTRREVAEEVSAAALAVKIAGGGVPAPGAAGAVTKIPFRGTRRTIAKRLRESMNTAVHFTVMDEAEVTPLDRAREQIQRASGEKVSYLPFVVSAVCRAVKRFPSLNAIVDDANEEILRHSAVHIGIATDTEHGLSVPVVFDADTLGVLEIGRHVSELAKMTRERSIPRERLQGSTFTISNVGSYAGRFATPVINYPEVAILAVGRVREGVVAQDGAIRIGKLLPLSLACDHRVVDGAEAARCLAHVIELLQKPGELLGPARG